MKDHEVRELVDRLTTIARDYGQTQQLRERIAREVRPVAAVLVPATKPMTAHRAAYFMERFKREEKLLGPNEQAAIDYVLELLQSPALSDHSEQRLEMVAALPVGELS